jgi:hypothetical protein
MSEHAPCRKLKMPVSMTLHKLIGRVARTEYKQVRQELMTSCSICLEDLHVRYCAYKEEHHEYCLRWYIDSLHCWAARCPYHWCIRGSSVVCLLIVSCSYFSGIIHMCSSWKITGIIILPLGALSLETPWFLLPMRYFLRLLLSRYTSQRFTNHI